MKTNDVVRQMANAVMIPAAIVVNYLPMGNAVGKVARESEPLFSAAGWAFAIWGIIFIGHSTYGIYQALPEQRISPTLQRIGWLTAINSLLVLLWPIVFSRGHFTVAWLLILINLGVLLTIQARIRRGVPTRKEMIFVYTPYSLNLGWVCVAVLLNTAQYLNVAYHYSGSGLIFASIAGFIGVWMIRVRRNIPFALAVAWGLCGVASYRWSESPPLAAVATFFAVVIATLTFVQFGKGPHHHRHSRHHHLDGGIFPAHIYR